MRFIRLKKILSFAILFCSTAAAFGQCTSNCLNLDSQIKGSLWPAYSSDSGIANVYALTTGAPLGPSLKPGSVIIFKAAHANTGASTTTVDGSSAISIVNMDGSSLSAGEIPAGGIVTTIYDGVNLQLQGVTNSSAVSSPSTNTQYIYVPNCGPTGTTNNHLAKWGSNSVNDSCAVITATADAGTGIQVPLIGIVVSGGGTTGFAKIAIGGQAQCQLDSLGAVTQGDSLQISSITAGDCEPIGGTPVAPANENPDTHFIYGLSDVTAAASTVVSVDLTPISPGYGNIGGASPSLMAVLGTPAYGGTFAFPLRLYQMGSGLLSDLATGGFMRFSDQQGLAGQYYAKVGSCGGGGLLNCGLSSHDFLIDNLNGAFTSHEQVRFTTSIYSILDDEGSVSGTVNFFPWNGNVKKYTLTGNTTLVNNLTNGEQRNPGTIFEFLIVNSGSFTLTVPADWHGFPTVAASTTTVAFCAAQSDNSLWCAGSSSGSGTVTSVTCGTGLSGGTFTTSGTCALANTAVTPGSYTNVNATVDAQGRITAMSNGTGGGGANKVPFDQCTAGQSANAGNSFWTVFGFTNWDSGHWEFVLNTNADVWCSVRVPSNQTGTMQIILDLASGDSTNAHLATFNTADACTSSLNPQVGTLTAASTQLYSSTTTAYSNTELTFNVQSSCAIDQILVVKIHQASGGTNTSNVFMQPPKVKVM